MKQILLLLTILLPALARAQIITTVAGTGVQGDGIENIPATASQINFPGSLSCDNLGNYYFSQNLNKIRKISSLGIINWLAGNGTGGYNGDGAAATATEFNGVDDIIADKYGNIFVADMYNNRIRKIDIFGTATTYAGNGVAGFAGDGGPATAAKLYSPKGLAIDDSGNLFVADHANLRIRKIDKFGIISTIAGTGIPGINGDNGLATDAGIGGVTGLCLTYNGYLIFTDGYSQVRKISLNTSIISLVAGSLVPGYNGDLGPATLAMLSGPLDVAADRLGNLYISDYANNVIRNINTSGIISTCVGNGIMSYSGDGGAATAASINSPRGIAVDTCGNLLIADNGNHRIRKVAFNPQCIPASTCDITQPIPPSIYPNPTADQLYINQPDQKADYFLTGIAGQNILHGTLQPSTSTISLQSLPPGIYLLYLTTPTGQRTITKIIKQ